jgi:hypothetical protein
MIRMMRRANNCSASAVASARGGLTVRSSTVTLRCRSPLRVQLLNEGDGLTEVAQEILRIPISSIASGLGRWLSCDIGNRNSQFSLPSHVDGLLSSILVVVCALRSTNAGRPPRCRSWISATSGTVSPGLPSPGSGFCLLPAVRPGGDHFTTGPSCLTVCTLGAFCGLGEGRNLQRRVFSFFLK